MRMCVCSLAFLAFASLAGAQVASLPQGQVGEISCGRFLPPTDDKYYLGNVRSFLALAQRDFSYSATDQAVQNMGDGASIAVLKIVPPDDLIKFGFVKAYLGLARTAFSDPKLTFCAEDKTPEVTLFLLGYLREKVQDKELQDEIDSTREYVLKQAGPPKQSAVQVPSQSAK